MTIKIVKSYFSKIALCVYFFTFLSIQYLHAVPAFRDQISYKQPDGTTVYIKLFGDEFYNYKTTTDGYLLTEDTRGFLDYAKVSSNGEILSLNVRAHSVGNRSSEELKFISNLTPTTDLTSFGIQARAKRISSTTSVRPIQKSFPLAGKPKSLVILVNFSDNAFTISSPKQAFTNLLNQTGYSANGATGSSKDYFTSVSNGVFSPEFDVVGPYKLPNNIAFYGGNLSGSDKNPRQMVIDACALADADGVDFTQYDTDNNGYVDNVFIYYAGYNEAEGGSTNTVWPHRWTLGSTSTKYDGKIVFDYACTSELKGTSGSNMCGVGTFCHEFGHVLGLPDLYATNNATHHTMFNWDVMDYGPYNNSGRTPPSYSSYEKFYLGWLTPTELKTAKNITLDTLITSNQAYLISQTGAHNLKGANPNPVEFFMLENRQKKGWDTYLPGHGLLVTRVYYSSSTWSANTVNNTSTAMGVDIIEADGIATDASTSGDTYPGISNQTSYNPTLRAGNDISKPLTEITETKGIITFRFMGGDFNTNLAPIATSATNITQTSFTVNWQENQYVSSYLLDIFTVTSNNDTVYLDGFKSKDVGKVLSYDISGLKSETTYHYRLRSTDGAKTTIYSNEIIVITKAYTFDMLNPVALEATDITINSFIAHWTWNETNFEPLSYYLTVYTKAVGTGSEYTINGFDNSELPSEWTGINSYYSTSGYYRTSSPSCYFTNDKDYIQTPLYTKNINSIDFWYRGRSTSSSNALLIYSSSDGNTWNLIKTLKPIPTSAGENISLSETELGVCKAIKFLYSKEAVGNVAIDDIKISTQTVNNIPLDNYNNINVGNVTNYLVSGLDNLNDYYYEVKAYNNGEYSENSNAIKVKTLATSVNILSLPFDVKYIKHSDSFEIQYSGNELNNKITLFNLNGQKIYESVFNRDIVVPMVNHGMYMLKINSKTLKIIW